MDLVAPGLVLELVEWDSAASGLVSELVELVEWEMAALDLALEREMGLVLFQSGTSSSCSSDKVSPLRFHTPCHKMSVGQQHDNQGSERRRDSNGLGFLAPCAVRLELLRESLDAPCRDQIAASGVEHGPLFLL
jgi:hypothetical protein